MSEESKFMAVRAKFKCTVKSQHENGFDVTLEAVTTSDTPENKEFFKWTPSAKITMSTINPGAAESFIPGKSYYVDFVRAE